MTEIKVQSEKFLILNDSVSIMLNDNAETDVLIGSSISKLKAYGISIRGPPIVWVGMKITESIVFLERKLFLQCTGNLSKIPAGFERKDTVKIGPCIYARFIGREENLRYAFEKASVYAFENEIDLKKENYTVYLEKDDISATIDIFIPHEG